MVNMKHRIRQFKKKLAIHFAKEKVLNNPWEPHALKKLNNIEI